MTRKVKLLKVGTKVRINSVDPAHLRNETGTIVGYWGSAAHGTITTDPNQAISTAPFPYWVKVGIDSRAFSRKELTRVAPSGKRKPKTSLTVGTKVVFTSVSALIPTGAIGTIIMPNGNPHRGDHRYKADFGDGIGEWAIGEDEAVVVQDVS